MGSNFQKENLIVFPQLAILPEFCTVFLKYVKHSLAILANFDLFFQVGLSPSKKNCVICFIENPLKIMKNAFCFILKALFVLKIFKFLS